MIEARREYCADRHRSLKNAPNHRAHRAPVEWGDGADDERPRAWPVREGP